MSARDFDVVVFGATGFTGQLVAEYLARKGELAPERWALAGRNLGKLEGVRAHLASIDGRLTNLTLLTVEADDEAGLTALARRTQVVLSTVGPFVKHGYPVVAACVAGGAHYVDITGEPEFVAETILRHHEAARAKGLRIVSCCGFDSIPHDFGAWFTARALPATSGPTTIEAFVRAKGGFSGGTWQSAVGAMGRFRATQAAVKQARRPAEDGRSVGGVKRGLHRDDRVGAWAVPLPTIDPQVVLRSAALLPEYGSPFRYGHYARVKNLSTIVGAGAALGGAAVLAQLKPTRNWLLARKASGEGPPPEARAKHRFEVTFFGERDGASVHTAVRGGDPGYDETAKMISEAALCLARDGARRPDRAGVLTPVLALGEPMLERLQTAGIAFTVEP